MNNMLKEMFVKIRDWSSEFVSPFSEALKEACRITLFSIPGELIAVIQLKKIDPMLLGINISLIFLRALDKYLFEKSKSKGQQIGEAISGLSPI
jgi:hypothetical protein